MKCPHCNYTHREYDFDTDKEVIEGDEEFYTISNSITAEQTTQTYPYQRLKDIYGCPKCKILFIE